MKLKMHLHNIALILAVDDRGVFNFINSTVSKKSIQHDNFMHISPLFRFSRGGNCPPPPCPCLRAPMEVSKTTVIYVKFLHDVACQKLLTSAYVSRSYSKNNTGTVFLRHGVSNRLTLALSLLGCVRTWQPVYWW